MFTGIIETVGKIHNIRQKGKTLELTVESGKVAPKLSLGDSVAVNGVCVTVVKNSGKSFVVDISQETVLRSTLGRLAAGSIVNLETPLTPSSMLGGHMVQGHVDCGGIITGVKKTKNELFLEIELPAEWMKYIVEKGSIAMDGISLTVSGIVRNRIRMVIIPHTMKSTAILSRKTGDYVNIEVDIFGKYVYNFISNTFGKTANQGINKEFLISRGFI